ncbi:MAG TPA: hypothetical protein VJY62_19305, partial [Bacteroidia bacterium]|nr:hypothetical protein [Bacteroidia bacterium]
MEEYILKFGFPDRIHSDRGKEFCNQVLEGICKILKIKISTTLGYDPSCNGMVERFNGVIKSSLNKKRASSHSWEDFLPYVTFCHNVTPCLSTKFQPFELFFGRVTNIFDCPLDSNPSYTVDKDTYLQFFRENWQELLASANQNLVTYRGKMKSDFDKKYKTSLKFEIGENVMMMIPKSTRTKLGNFIFGPYEIINFNTTSVTLKAIGKSLKSGFITVPLERIIKIPRLLNKVKIKSKYPKMNNAENFEFDGYKKEIFSISILEKVQDMSLMMPAFGQVSEDDVPDSPPCDPRLAKFDLENAEKHEMAEALESIQLENDDQESDKMSYSTIDDENDAFSSDEERNDDKGSIYEVLDEGIIDNVLVNDQLTNQPMVQDEMTQEEIIMVSTQNEEKN